MERDEVESGLEFLGFIIFENKLKPATAGTIEELGQAGIRQVMCTGDNILTAISVARKCSLIDRTAHCFMAHIAEGTLALRRTGLSTDVSAGDTRDPNARLSWQSVDNPLFKLDERTLTVSTFGLPFHSTCLTTAAFTATCRRRHLSAV